MKIKKVLLSICMICLAVLVLAGATVPVMQFSAQAMVVRAASTDNSVLESKELFDSKGRYTVDMDYLKSSLVDGQVFNFFGHDWHIVWVNEKANIATFWMIDPYTPHAYEDQDEYVGTIFNKNIKSGNGFFKDGTNIWSNGYSNMIWESNSGEVLIGQSEIRELLFEEAKNMIDSKAYAKYKNKVIAGYVEGTNEVVSEVKIPSIAFSKDNLNQVEYETEETNKLTAQYGLNTDDRLWLPSINELKTKWNLHENIIRWTETSNNSGFAWLRNPSKETDSNYANSAYATCIRYDRDPNKTNTGTVDDLFFVKAIKQEAGVRPAIHLDITDLSAGASTDDGWFNEDWLKVLFIVVCVLGIVGIALVITAVVLKARKKQAK